MPPPSINDLDACQRVATMRRGGIPDALIAYELGISLDRLRVVCPDDGSDPLGLNRDRSHSGADAPPRPRPRVPNPHLHNNIGPFSDSPYVAPPAPPSENGGGLAVLVLLFFFAG